MHDKHESRVYEIWLINIRKTLKLKYRDEHLTYTYINFNKFYWLVPNENNELLLSN